MAVDCGGYTQINLTAQRTVRIAAPKTGAYAKNNPRGINGGGTVNSGFAKIFDQVNRQNNAPELTISKHAEIRLRDRNIMLSGAQKEKIANALAKADSKGVRDVLVIIDGLAIVADTKSMTIITAADGNNLRQNIFTNIDGAVFA
jgi:flagellar operon protein